MMSSSPDVKYVSDGNLWIDVLTLLLDVKRLAFGWLIIAAFRLV